tara:strand:+ start:5440 stop:6084 length:645 start_codon:yes stop_codon:yes gene_type:complete
MAKKSGMYKSTSGPGPTVIPTGGTGTGGTIPTSVDPGDVGGGGGGGGGVIYTGPGDFNTGDPITDGGGFGGLLSGGGGFSLAGQSANPFQFGVYNNQNTVYGGRNPSKNNNQQMAGQAGMNQANNQNSGSSSQAGSGQIKSVLSSVLGRTDNQSMAAAAALMRMNTGVSTPLNSRPTAITISQSGVTLQKAGDSASPFGSNPGMFAPKYQAQKT